jgi:hypothetical protein
MADKQGGPPALLAHASIKNFFVLNQYFATGISFGFARIRFPSRNLQ